MEVASQSTSGNSQQQVKAQRMQWINTLENRGEETLAEVAHEARNIVTALGLYCDLLREPGVLTESFSHYGSELGLLATAGRRLAEKMAALGSGKCLVCSLGEGAAADVRTPGRGPAESEAHLIRFEPAPPPFIVDFAAELKANRTLLSAIAGLAIEVKIHTDGGAQPVRLTGEDLTRILVNLVRNAAEVMPTGGSIEITLLELAPTANLGPALSLGIRDTGPGIPENLLPRIFQAGFSAHAQSGENPHWPSAHRGLGLAITRSLVEAAGGQIEAVNSNGGGAHFFIRLPIRRG